MPRGQAHYIGPDVLAPAEVTYGSDGDNSGLHGEASPTSASQVSRSKLEMHEQDLRRIESQVRDHFIRQSSLVQEQ